jgi:hypothetical protein
MAPSSVGRSIPGRYQMLQKGTPISGPARVAVAPASRPPAAPPQPSKIATARTNPAEAWRIL